MLSSKTRRKVAWVIGAALIAAGPTAYSHTTVKSQATEGVTDDNAIKIGHGCESSDKPVIAQSVVFPGAAAETIASNGSAVTLFDTIEQGSIAGLVATVQDRSIFGSQQDKLDSLDNQIGFSGINGVLVLGKQGRVPFQFTAPNFVFTSCAKRLLIQLAIADVCMRGPKDNNLQPGNLNLWIPDNGSQYAMVGGQNGVEGVGEPATLVVNRNLTTNPLPSACGGGFDVTVRPSAAEIDGNLPIPGFWK